MCKKIYSLINKLFDCEEDVSDILKKKFVKNKPHNCTYFEKYFVITVAKQIPVTIYC